MKTADLTGAPLDYWVARAEGWELESGTWWVIDRGPAGGALYYSQHRECDWKPSTDWAQCGPLIEKWCYALVAQVIGGKECWSCDPIMRDALPATDYQVLGATPQEAICRAVVRAAFGDEVPEVQC